MLGCSVARLPGLLFSVILGVWVAGCASLPTDVARPISTALTNPGDTRLGQAVAARAAKAASPPAPAGSNGSANATTTARVVTSPGGATTTLPALPDDTDLRLLDWTWAPSAMRVDKPSKIAADASTGLKLLLKIIRPLAPDEML